MNKKMRECKLCMMKFVRNVNKKDNTTKHNNSYYFAPTTHKHNTSYYFTPTKHNTRLVITLKGVIYLRLCCSLLKFPLTRQVPFVLMLLQVTPAGGKEV